MQKLSSYWEKIRLSKPEMLGKPVGGSKESEPLDFCAYCLDGGKPYKENLDMGKDVGLASCKRCDYFVFGKDAVYLIEFSDILKKKDALRAGWHEDKDHAFRYLSSLSAEEREEVETQLFEDFVVNENLVKMYGTVLILCWFAHGCESMKKNIQKRKVYKFKIVCNMPEDQVEEETPKILENIHSELEKKVSGLSLAKKSKKHPNAPSHSFVSEVEFIFYHDKKTLENKLKEIPVCESDGPLKSE